MSLIRAFVLSALLINYEKEDTSRSYAMAGAIFFVAALAGALLY